MDACCRIADINLQPEVELAKLIDETGATGAIASLTGITRQKNASGKTVIALRLDHHPRLTLNSMREIAQAAAQRFTLTAVHVVHRCGEVTAGDPIVFVAAASAHRKASMAAADYIMDRLKTEAFFWKCEFTASGGRWVEPTSDDYASAANWTDQNGGN